MEPPNQLEPPDEPELELEPEPEPEPEPIFGRKWRMLLPHTFAALMELKAMEMASTTAEISPEAACM